MPYRGMFTIHVSSLYGNMEVRIAVAGWNFSQNSLKLWCYGYTFIKIKMYSCYTFIKISYFSGGMFGSCFG